MKIFSHVTDFGPEGMQNVFPMAAVADKVVLWGPSAFYINQAKEAGHSPFTPEDIATLVKNKKITIMGRRWWLTDERERRRRTTPEQPWNNWVPEFDDVIREIAIEDEHEPNLSKKRVIIEKVEPGLKYPSQVFDNSKTKGHARDLKYAKLLLAKGNFASALAKSLRSASNEEERLKIILRNMKNHKVAYKHSGAEWALIESENARLYSQAIMSPVRITTPNDLDIEQLVPLIKIISQLSKDTRREKLMEVLEMPELLKARIDAREFLQPGVNLSRKIRKDIEKNTRSLKKIGIDAAKPGTFLSVAGVLLNAVSTQIQVNPLWSFSVGAVPMAKATLEIANVIPDSYEGITFPFVMAKGIKHPRRKNLRKVTKELKDFEQNDETFN